MEYSHAVDVLVDSLSNVSSCLFVHQYKRVNCLTPVENPCTNRNSVASLFIRGCEVTK